MYCSTFFELLHAAQRIDAAEKIQLLNILTVADPNTKRSERSKFIRQYQQIVDGPEEVTPEIIRRDRALLLKKLRGK
jgi:hypothetical protein